MTPESILYPQGYAWPGLSLTYSIRPEVDAWAPQVDQAMRAWDLASGITLTSVATGGDIDVTTLIAVSAPRFSLGWSGFWADDDTAHIVHGFVGIGYAPSDYAADKAAWIALHEVGHALGLSHPDQMPLATEGHQGMTVMAYSPFDGLYRDHPAPLDVHAIQALYGPDRRADGTADADTLTAGAGADWLYGYQGDDALYGLQGDDLLYGGQGADTLFGGQGDDTMAGGLGEDVFAPGRGDDVITDFRPADDRLFVAGSWTVEDTDGGALVCHDAGTVLLVGVLAADMFVLV